MHEPWVRTKHHGYHERTIADQHEGEPQKSTNQFYIRLALEVYDNHGIDKWLNRSWLSLDLNLFSTVGLVLSGEWYDSDRIFTLFHAFHGMISLVAASAKDPQQIYAQETWQRDISNKNQRLQKKMISHVHIVHIVHVVHVYM